MFGFRKFFTFFYFNELLMTWKISDITINLNLIAFKHYFLVPYQFPSKLCKDVILTLLYG